MSTSPSQAPWPSIGMFLACTLAAVGGAALAARVWLVAYIFSEFGVMFAANPSMFAAMVTAMLLPGLLAFCRISPVRWIGIGFTLPTQCLLALIAWNALTGAPPLVNPRGAT